jgi:hypothetical protein
VASTNQNGRSARAKKKYVPSAKQLASDEKLREELRNFDLKKFDKALDKAINPNRR